MTREETVAHILKARDHRPQSCGTAFAPVNIALCKYWGKRDETLNLPCTSSLSISLNPLGADTQVSTKEGGHDEFVLNGVEIPRKSTAFIRVSEYLDLFRPHPDTKFRVKSRTNVPVAAGVASSAAGFAALAKALDNLFNWGLSRRDLSILARLGSGSASRSVSEGFVEWHAGKSANGMDSYAERIDCEWPRLAVALLEISVEPKHIGSREAMARTVRTSQLYKEWPQRVESDIEKIREALRTRDIRQLGATAESNALAMHATMLDSRPPVLYWRPETLSAIEKIWELRRSGRDIYFTMDAGPNIKMLFDWSDFELVENQFEPNKVITPFGV